MDTKFESRYVNPSLRINGFNFNVQKLSLKLLLLELFLLVIRKMVDYFERKLNEGVILIIIGKNYIYRFITSFNVSKAYLENCI